MKALVFNNLVIDVQETEFPVHESMTWVDCTQDVRGWSYTNGVFTPPQQQVEPELTLDERRASAKIGPLDLGMKLAELGLFDQINDWANNKGGLITYAWNRATFFERLHPMILAAQTELGWTDAQVDEIFGLCD